MKLYAYEDGDYTNGEEYEDMTPSAAAQLFVEERDSDPDSCHLIVEAKDDAARALGGWTEEDGDLFKMFKAEAVVTWSAVEVKTSRAPAPLVLP